MCRTGAGLSCTVYVIVHGDICMRMSPVQMQRCRCTPTHVRSQTPCISHLVRVCAFPRACSGREVNFQMHVHSVIMVQLPVRSLCTLICGHPGMHLQMHTGHVARLYIGILNTTMCRLWWHKLGIMGGRMGTVIIIYLCTGTCSTLQCCCQEVCGITMIMCTSSTWPRPAKECVLAAAGQRHGEGRSQPGSGNSHDHSPRPWGLAGPLQALLLVCPVLPLRTYPVCACLRISH
jgi:hypothetical protein